MTVDELFEKIKQQKEAGNGGLRVILNDECWFIEAGCVLYRIAEKDKNYDGIKNLHNPDRGCLIDTDKTTYERVIYIGS